MSESLDRANEVPELTADEIQARVLHRDGLMLVIDKPAGLPVHRGPRAAPTSNPPSTPCATGCRARRSSPTGSTATPRAVWCWDATARPPPRSACCSSMARLQKPTGQWSRAAPPRTRAPSTCRLAASTPSAAGGRSRIPMGRRRSPTGRCWAAARPGLARAGAGHRPHPPIAGALRRERLADRRRQHLWQRSPFRRTAAAPAFPRNRDSDFSQQGSGARGGAGTGASTSAAQGLRLERGVTSGRHGRACPWLVPAIHVFAAQKARRGCPHIGERKRRRPSDG